MAVLAKFMRNVVVALAPRPRPVSATLSNSANLSLVSVPVSGVARDVRVKIASEPEEWEQAFRLVGLKYQARGYQQANDSGIRFTPYHALSDSVVFVAKEKNEVIATLSLVLDNTILGLPMQSIYHHEVDDLRREGRRLVEVTSLSDKGLGLREFLPVFKALMRLMTQYGISQDADTWVISINPRHKQFYNKVMGFVPFGALKPYPLVENAPAEGFLLDVPLFKDNAPDMFEEIFGEWLPAEVLTACQMPVDLVQRFGRHMTPEDQQYINWVLNFDRRPGSLRRWVNYVRNCDEALRSRLNYTKWCPTQTEPARVWTFL